MNTTLIIAAFLGLWLVLFIPFMIVNAKRKKKAESFVSGNNDKAVIHLYCKNIKINGQNISVFNPVTGENLEKIVALEPGNYVFEGVFETTETGLGTNKNLKTEAVQFNLNMERGCKYSAAMYLYSPEDRKSYYKGEVGEEILSIPLTLYEGSENVKAYVICYKEH
ncbi:MAG: hypothetical protein ACTTKY_07230 [Catonella sp.]